MSKDFVANISIISVVLSPFLGGLINTFLEARINLSYHGGGVIAWIVATLLFYHYYTQKDEKMSPEERKRENKS